MTEAERKRVLRGVHDEDQAALARGEVTEAVWRLAYVRGDGVGRAAAAQVTAMLQAARDPREAAVDAHLRKSKEKP